MLAEIWNRCETVEECYEFMLAYAAQGLPSDRGSESGGQVREFLHRVLRALPGLSETCALAVKEEGLEPADKYSAFLAVSTATLVILLPPLSWFWHSPPSAPS
jgi:hypothetical protein